MKLKILLSIILLYFLSSCRSQLGSDIVSMELVPDKSHVQMRIELMEMTYLSDGLKIKGYIHKPMKVGKYPVILYNRGGNRDLGTHNPEYMAFQEEMAMAGYVVFSTQLRGNKYSEGKDEMGGDDLNDILKLIDLAGELEYADETNIGAYGISRGGMNTYQLSRATDSIKCIAVVGAPIDPRLDFNSRPDMYTKVFYPLVGDTIKRKSEYDRRSPIKWVSEINEPALILHGLDDWRVTPQNAEMMISKMKELGNTFEYKLFEDGDHSLSSHVGERNELVINWFDKHLKL